MNVAQTCARVMAIAGQHSLAAVMQAAVEVAAAMPAAALTRLWLLQEDAECPACSTASRGRARALHLRASAGASLTPGDDWTSGEAHHRAVDGSGTIPHIASTGESVRIRLLAEEERWLPDPDWARREGVLGFAGHPVVFRGEVLGVLAVFRRREIDDEFWDWLRVIADAAAVAIANARAFEALQTLNGRLEHERDDLREEVQRLAGFGEIVGRGPAIQRVRNQVALVAATDTSVLILGEPGSGKELVARAIHQQSARASGPFVRLDCASTPRRLLASACVGHVKGSFAGAVGEHTGRFQLADGGTLFLDEVGEIPPPLQVTLLRLLQDGEFEPLGDARTRRVSVRVIAASTRDLRHEVADGRFRLDLYSRLGVLPVELPPLRERPDDIGPLVTHAFRLASTRLRVPLPRLAKPDLERARAYHWPGNVHELQNVVERAVMTASGGMATLDLPGGTPPDVARLPAHGYGEVISEREWRRRERENVQLALRQANFRVSGRGGAAELLGVNPRTLTSRLKALGLGRRSRYDAS